jgi:hypothetical protein
MRTDARARSAALLHRKNGRSESVVDETLTAVVAPEDNVRRHVQLSQTVSRVLLVAIWSHTPTSDHRSMAEAFDTSHFEWADPQNDSLRFHRTRRRLGLIGTTREVGPRSRWLCPAVAIDLAGT